MNGLAGAVDCDVHPTLPGLSSLCPYLDEAWKEQFKLRRMHRPISNNYPPNAPLSVRPDCRPAEGPPAQLPQLRSRVLDRAGIGGAAICNGLYGVQLLFSEDLAAAIARAMNELMAHELLDREPRLRASIEILIRLVASSMNASSAQTGPRSSNQACSEPSICTNSPRHSRGRRGWCGEGRR